MIQIQEPVSACTIQVVELVRQDHLDGSPLRLMNSYTFASVQGLKAYLVEHYSVALSLGAKVVRPAASKYNEKVIGRLSVHFTDRFQSSIYELQGVNELAAFLDAHAPLAAMLGYTKK